MALILTMAQTKGTPARSGVDRQIRTLTQGTLSIGRAAGNDWVLADPDQHLSRTHCMIAFEGGRYMLTDLSTNGLLINGAREPTTRNSRFVLSDGDTVQLGTYQLTVAEADDPPPRGAGGVLGAGSFLTPRADPFAQGGAPGGAGGGDNPLDFDPLDDPLGRPPGEYGGEGQAGVFAHPLPHTPPALRGADPFDAAENARHRPASLDEDLFRGNQAAEAWQGAAQHDRADARSQAFNPPRAVAPINVNDIDFDDLLGDIMPVAAPHPLAPPPTAPPRSAAPGGGPAGGMTGFPDALDDLLGDFPPLPDAAPVATPPAVPPAVPAAPPPASRVAPLPVAPPPVAPPPVAPPSRPPEISPFDTDMAEAAAPDARPAQPTPPAKPAEPAAPPAEQVAALFAAFAEGAGVPRIDLLAAPEAQADPQAAMRAIGALFAAFVAGTREVLMSRAEIKHEMRVEQTMMRARDNNALKFSVSPQEALAALLQPSRPGYKPPLAAVEEAFSDIRGHEMAVMAGLQTALIALLRRFDPAALEGRLQRGMLDTILPGARKARFWELFCATYKDIASEAEDDFHSIFGREFARAYDAQIRKL